MNLLGLLLLLGFGLAVFIVATSVHTIYTLTHPPRRGFAYALARSLPADPAALPGSPAFESWTFRSRGMDLPVWDIAGRGGDAAPTVILSHGWGDSRIIALRCVPALLAVARRVIVWDLPGHGESPGTCSLGTREVEDLRALIDRVAPDAGAGGIVLYGSSLGAGISIAAAAALGNDDGRIAGVIAEAPYRVPITPARNVLRLAGLPYRANLPIAMAFLGARFGYGLRWAQEDRAGGFDRAEHAAALRTPLLVLHGDLDAVCPVEDGRAIAAAAPAGGIAEIPGGEHNNLLTDERFAAACEDAVGVFVAGIGRMQRGDEPRTQ